MPKKKLSGKEGGVPLVDCPTQLTLVTWICQLCSMTNTSEKYERTQQGNLLDSDQLLSKPYISLPLPVASLFVPATRVKKKCLCWEFECLLTCHRILSE